MILIVGIGNPGSAYQDTRHNVGRMIVESLQKRFDAPEFQLDRRLNALLTRANHESGKASVLALPETLVNKSGAAVGALTKRFRVPTERIFLVHDEADLRLGRAKLSFGRNAAGHKGIASVIRALHTKNFWRFRVGIAGANRASAEQIVLQPFTPAERRILKRIIKKTVDAAARIPFEKPEQIMNTYNNL